MVMNEDTSSIQIHPFEAKTDFDVFHQTDTFQQTQNHVNTVFTISGFCQC